MLPAGDFVVFIALLLLGAVWLSRCLFRKLFRTRWGLPHHPSIHQVAQMRRPLAQLLQREGYEPLSGREEIPIQIQMADGRHYTTRLHVDGWAERMGQLYVVKQRRARARVPLTAAALRDHFLIYSLLYQCHGILYIDLDQQLVHELEFSYPSLSNPFQWRTFLFPFFLGMGLLYLLIR